MLKTIRQGDTGKEVFVARCLLGMEEFNDVFDEAMTEKVIAFQTEHNDNADGVIGKATWTALAESAPTVSTSKHKYGNYASAVQRLLNDDSVKVDGIYGSKTKAAVRAFQASVGLSADGIVGHNTWRAFICGDEAGEYVFKQPPNFKQYDSRWASKMYSNHGDKKQTMRSSACGPTSMADIVAELWDSKITPYDLAVKSMEWGCRTYDSGTSSTFFRKCADLYKASKYVTTSNIDTAINCLRTGGYVVVCFGKSKWTSNGHYCCLWKYDGTNFYVNDPASAKSTRAKGTYNEVKAARKGFYCFWR